MTSDYLHIANGSWIEFLLPEHKKQHFPKQINRERELKQKHLGCIQHNSSLQEPLSSSRHLYWTLLRYKSLED